MGDRANILVKSGETIGVCLYTHWGGHQLPTMLQNALKKRERWDDEQYLNRIIFCEMMGDVHSEKTGCGITGYVWDGGDRIIHVDVDELKVIFLDKEYSFEEYIELDLEKEKFTF